MKTDGNTLYYSSLLNNEAPQSGKAQVTPTRRKDANPAPSPRKTIESASSSISNAVVTSFNSAKKIKDRARSFVPKKLLAAQCTPATSGRKREGNDIILDEAATPVMFYPDEDAVAKRVSRSNLTLVDPFSFEDSDSPDGKMGANDFNSPTSVVPMRLFPEEVCSSSDDPSGTTTKTSIQENAVFDEVVSFDCPIFTQDFKFDPEDTSIDMSEAIKSINAMSIKEETNNIRESIRARKEARDEGLELWQDPILSWDGFTRSASFTKCKWEPKSDDTASL
mmetsp:Transcript_33052/g.69562  ORF Transcript_33052/g.69562 Transcript_33052/m.69562 type:complete len:279 (-) Transcript_33052:194-1030(-)|eukprot:CAMPEP_0172324122 /NCGR_PEP_ID=MMETSP1058-20130122/50512_1 /TAXON_ID=83371 /ORGANISM="Detonula confervacea, Strain CCMP 353" /LENGTH=278 /DNA_ID=CAMNT_0013040305 /DNA_START=471 /DNA_END=1307 /DNA_ORIENTATION=-